MLRGCQMDPAPGGQMLKFREPELLARLFDGEFELGLGGGRICWSGQGYPPSPPHRLVRALLGALAPT
jgi:hypothetical protein